MTALTATRPVPSGVQQWWVLTARLIAPTLRNGEVAVGVAVSAAATASLYIPLNRLMDGPDLKMSSYAQYLVPLIVLQAIAFASISTAFRAATDSVQGINRRFQSLPIPPTTPLVARITASVYRCVIGLVVALVCGYVIGFRFHRGALDVAGFCLVALLTGLALAFMADTIGTNSRNPTGTAQWLLLPQLIFGFLSVNSTAAPVSRVDPADRPQSAHLPHRRRPAGSGRRHWARSSTGHLVGHRTRSGVGTRRDRADATVGYRGLPAENLMAVLVSAAVDAEAHSKNVLPDLLSQTMVLTRRLLIRSVRNPMTLVHAVLLPVAFLLTLKVVFGDSITSSTGENALYRSVPLVALVATMAGSTTGVVGINAERIDGFLARMWALPIHRAAGLLARLASETIRLFGTTLVILGTGIILGFRLHLAGIAVLRQRFHRGVAGALVWVAVPVIFGVAFAALATTVAVYWPKAVLVEAMQPVIILGATFCTGFVPLERYPDWVQPMVRNQPMSPAVDAMRGLSVGGPVLSPMISALVWCAGIFVACLWPLMVGYRRASTSR